MVFSFFSRRRRHTRSVSAFLLNRSSDPQYEKSHTADSEVDLVHQQTQNQRYGSSHIGATAKDISNVVTDRSEERRVGKECRSGWVQDGQEKKPDRSARAPVVYDDDPAAY